MFGNIGDQFGKAALVYAGLSVLPDMVSALGRGAVAAIESVLPASNSYNNPANLGSHIDTRA